MTDPQLFNLLSGTTRVRVPTTTPDAAITDEMMDDISDLFGMFMTSFAEAVNTKYPNLKFYYEWDM